MSWWSDRAAKYAVLSAAQEIELGTAVRSWLDHPDGIEHCPPMIRRRGLRARNRLVEGNLRLVLHFAGRWRTRVPQSSYADLIQAGNEGLITAANKFIPSKGYKFSTYAYWWLKREFDHWVQQKQPIIRPPTTAHAEAHRVRTLIRAYLAEHGTPPTRAEIAAGASVRLERIEELRQWLRPLASLDAPVQMEDGDACALAELVAAPDGHDSEAATLAAAALDAVRAVDPDTLAALELVADGAGVREVAALAGMGLGQLKRRQRELLELRELPEVAAALAAA